MTEMIVKANGRVCCPLDLPCCHPPAGSSSRETRVRDLAHFLRRSALTVSAGAVGDEICHQQAVSLLQHFDLVPKGLGAAIVAAYSPWLTGENPGLKAGQPVSVDA